jgi:DNA-binding CsgD family transcriptional regulator
MKRKTGPTTTEAEIRALVDQGLTMAVIADRLKVSVHLLRNACSLLGIYSKSGIDRGKLEGWAARIAAGATAAEIAAEVGCSRQHIYQTLSYAGLPTNTRAAIKAKHVAGA